MASLLVVNGGGLLSLPNVADKHPAVLSGGPWFVGGVVAAILSGCLAWFNCNCITTAVDWRTNWQEVDYQDSPHAERWDWWALAFTWAAVVTALASLIAFATGAIIIQQSVS
jgi:hypothetical protein